MKQPITLPTGFIFRGRPDLSLRLTSVARLPLMSAPLTMLFSNQLHFT